MNQLIDTMERRLLENEIDEWTCEARTGILFTNSTSVAITAQLLTAEGSQRLVWCSGWWRKYDHLVVCHDASKLLRP